MTSLPLWSLRRPPLSPRKFWTGERWRKEKRVSEKLWRTPRCEHISNVGAVCASVLIRKRLVIVSFLPDNSCIELTGVCCLHCLTSHQIITFPLSLSLSHSLYFHELQSKELVILITFCECARRANKTEMALLFSEGWQSAEAVWLSWAHQNKAEPAELHHHHHRHHHHFLCFVLTPDFLVSSPAVLYFWYFRQLLLRPSNLSLLPERPGANTAHDAPQRPD